MCSQEDNYHHFRTKQGRAPPSVNSGMQRLISKPGHHHRTHIQSCPTDASMLQVYHPQSWSITCGQKHLGRLTAVTASIGCPRTSRPETRHLLKHLLLPLNADDQTTASPYKGHDKNQTAFLDSDTAILIDSLCQVVIENHCLQAQTASMSLQPSAPYITNGACHMKACKPHWSQPSSKSCRVSTHCASVHAIMMSCAGLSWRMQDLAK